MALVGLIVLGYLVIGFVVGIAMMVQGTIGPLEVIVIMSTGGLFLALFGSGVVAAKVIRGHRSRQSGG